MTTFFKDPKSVVTPNLGTTTDFGLVLASHPNFPTSAYL
ncbi:hypothetical protein PLO_1283 [Pediococcus acidilactici NGRI 0510Q]|nr:hypothetical protein PLO_1283 [Pediococcus acidilactici NGRI 0510Q]